mgnify:CR=1 FL=1
MNINWKIRLMNKAFWISAIPALLLMIQAAAAVFGYQLELGEIGDRILNLVNAMFAFLTILGVVNDPTTAGVADSRQAMTYSRPKK